MKLNMFILTNDRPTESEGVVKEVHSVQVASCLWFHTMDSASQQTKSV